ncbi:DNA primase large subunit-like [Diadema setosum]|uniref:DNA primase large subunit-like n=1 Tax=Diadema setosum TaxID=31175 RepID=UPI003B3BBA08
MAFYIKPPGGKSSLEKMRLYTSRRMSFLGEVLSCADAKDFQLLLEKGSTAIDSDCLIEGSRKDRTSHFLLRLICSCDAEASSFFIRSETELFCHRFASMNSAELTTLLSSTYRFLSKIKTQQACRDTTSPSKGRAETSVAVSVTSMAHRKYSDALNNLHDVLGRTLKAKGSWRDVIQCYMEYSRDTFGIPFQHAACLVASRQVRLERGTALVPFSNLHIVMATLFEDIVRKGVAIASIHSQEHLLDDDRMQSLYRDVRARFFRMPMGTGSGLPTSSQGSIQGSQLDSLHHFFPPCMRHLHRMLRKKHRLRHFSRVQYTLFLKEIGLPVDDAIQLWKSEYSQPSGCHGSTGGCQHSWARDWKRYTYNIRHLYGLEGSRTNYRAHSCRSIQGMQLGFGEEGGCPLKHFDDASIQQILDLEDLAGSQRDQVLHERKRGCFQRACGKILHHRMDRASERCSDVEDGECKQKRVSLETCSPHGSCGDGICSSSDLPGVGIPREVYTSAIKVDGCHTRATTGEKIGHQCPCSVGRNIPCECLKDGKHNVIELRDRSLIYEELCNEKLTSDRISMLHDKHSASVRICLESRNCRSLSTLSGNNNNNKKNCEAADHILKRECSVSNQECTKFLRLDVHRVPRVKKVEEGTLASSVKPTIQQHDSLMTKERHKLMTEGTDESKEKVHPYSERQARSPRNQEPSSQFASEDNRSGALPACSKSHVSLDGVVRAGRDRTETCDHETEVSMPEEGGTVAARLDRCESNLPLNAGGCSEHCSSTCCDRASAPPIFKEGRWDEVNPTIIRPSDFYFSLIKMTNGIT